MMKGRNLSNLDAVAVYCDMSRINSLTLVKLLLTVTSLALHTFCPTKIANDLLLTVPIEY